MKPVKLGIIGCGIAVREYHLPALLKLRDKFTITAVCNNTESRAKEFSELLGKIPYFLDYRELLLQPEVEAVDIALPPFLNYEVTRAALAAGKHVIVEKPLAATLKDARAMLALEKRFPQVKMVAENFRYHPAFHRLKPWIAEGRIGEPYAVFWDVFRHLDANNRYVQTGWRVENPLPGGFITDGGVHNIAALRLLFGDIVAGRAFTQSVNPQIGPLDGASLQFETAQGVRGVLNIFVSAQNLFKNELLILGRNGSIQIENNRRIRIHQNGRVHEEAIESDTSYQAEFEDFHQAIRNGRPVASSFVEAYRDFEIMLAALDWAQKWPTIQIGQ
jgi:predicted dehydrogenase